MLQPWRSEDYRHGRVPKAVDLADKFAKTFDAKSTSVTSRASNGSGYTTLMIRNIPNRYTQAELMQELTDLGFADTFDFFYVPLDRGTMSNVGYAFVNFTSCFHAARCEAALENYRFKLHRRVSGKIASVSVAHLQGLEANIRHYQNAAVNVSRFKQRRPMLPENAVPVN